MLKKISNIEMSFREFAVKTMVVMFFVVPGPPVLFTVGGMYIDKYVLGTLPILTIIGVIIGTIVAFFGTRWVILYGHNKEKGG